jgi:isopentenyl-diphosphate delta-isomerase
MKKLILVDENDKEVGEEEKLKAHLEGKRHRAFSILIFNSKGELLLQQRARGKYHSGSLWSNTCCSHPEPGKDLKDEAEKRLKEEMGIEADLREVFSLSYNVKVGNLVENEIDHVFVGEFDGEPQPSPEEAEDWKWISLDNLEKDIQDNPEKYTPWFKLILKRLPKENIFS